MNKELKLERVLLRKESIYPSDIFLGSLSDTKKNMLDIFDRLEKEAKKKAKKDKIEELKK